MPIPRVSNNNWFFYEQIDALKNSPVSKTIFGIEYVGYLDNKDQVIITKNYCPHRGYPLDKCQMIKEGLECRYHGWVFGESGICKSIPGIKKALLPNIRLKTIEVRIVDGYVWINLSKNNKPFIPPTLFNNLDPQIIFRRTVKAGTYLLIENTLDPFHTPYIHRGLVRSQKSKDVRVEISLRSDQISGTYLNEGVQSGIISKIFGSSDMIAIGRYIHPGILQLEYKNKIKQKLLISSFLTPISDTETSAYILIQYKKWPLRIDILFRPLFKWFMSKLLIQDIKAVEIQQLNLLNANKEQFVSTRLDFLNSGLHEIINTNGNAKELNKTIEISI